MRTEPLLIVRQEWRGGRRPEDDVFDRTWSLVARGRYRSAEVAKALLRELAIPVRSADLLQIHATDGTLLFSTLFPGNRARTVILVHDGDGKGVGEAIKTKGQQRAHYELRDRGRIIGAFEVQDWRQSSIRFTGADGVEVAEARTVSDDAPFEVPPGTDGHYVRTLREVAEPLRSLVVVCGVVLQAAIGDESRDSTTTIFRLPLIPSRFDPLKRMLRTGPVG